MFTVGSITASLKLQMGQWKTGVRTALADAKGLRAEFGRLNTGLRTMAIGLGVVATSAALSMGGMVAAAAHVEEAENLFTVSMGKMADSTRAWSEEVSASIHRNATTIRAGVANFNVMFRAMGFTEEAAASMSKGFTKLAFDISSFYNIGHEEALDKLRAGISGEVEPLKRLGLLINETSIKAFALKAGIVGVGEEMSEQQKVVARYGAIMEQTKLAQGDLARTSNSTTNQFRAMKEQVLSLSQTIGGALLPTVNKWISGANQAISVVIAWVKENKETAASLATTAAYVTAATLGLSGFVLGLNAVISTLRTLRTVALSTYAILGGPWTLVAAAVLELVAALYILRAVWKQTMKWMGGDLSVFQDGAIGTFQAIRDAGMRAADMLASHWATKFRGLLAVVDGIRGAAKGLGDELLGKKEMPTTTTGWLKSWLPAQIRIPLAEAEGAIRKIWNRDTEKDIKDAAKRTFDGVKTHAKKAATELGDMSKTASEMTAAQIKEDFAGITDSLKEQFPEIAKLIQDLQTEVKPPDFEGYEAFNPEALLQGAGAAGELGKAAKSAAKEMEQLKEEAASIRLDALPAEALNAELRNIQDLARKFPDLLDDAAVSQRFTKLWEEFRDRGVDAAGDMGTALAGLADGYREKFLAAQHAADKAINEQKFQDLLQRISPAQAAFAEAREMLQTLKDVGRVGETDMTLLGEALWERLRTVSVSVLDEIIGKLQQIEGSGPLIDKLLDARFDSMNTEAAARGQDIANQLVPETQFVTRIRQDLTDLSAAGMLNDDMANLLQEDFWRELESLGEESIRAIIAQVEDLSPAFASSMRASLAEMQRFKKAAKIDEIADAFGAIGSQVEGLSPELARLGRAMRAASSIMHAVSAAMRGDWLAVAMAILEAVDALGIFNDSNEEELHGMAEAMDELGDAVERWADQLTESLVEFIRTGKAGFKDFVDTVLDELLKIGISNLIVEPIVDWASGFFAKGGAVEDGREIRAFAKGAALDSGNIIPFAKGGHITDGPELFQLKDRKLGIRGEAGPEGILPLKRMGDGKLGVMAKLGGGEALWNVASVLGELVPMVRNWQAAALFSGRAPAMGPVQMDPLRGMMAPLGGAAIPPQALMLTGALLLALRAYNRRQERESEAVGAPLDQPSLTSVLAAFSRPTGVRNTSSAGSDIEVNVHAYGLPPEAVQVKDRGSVDGKRVMDIIVRGVRKGMAEGSFDSDLALNFGLARRV